jgi:hypothetical protein
MFANPLDHRSPLPVEEALDFDTSLAPPPEEPDAGAQMQPGNAPAKYSPIFKMGLFFSVPSFSLVPTIANLTQSRAIADGPRP